MKVFLLEDDTGITDLIAILLKQLELDVFVHTRVTGCIDAVKSYEPDLLLIDYYLEDAKTDMIIRDIKSLDRFAYTPIILVTAAVEAEKIANELGVNEFIRKPFDINIFQKKVLSFKGKKR